MPTIDPEERRHIPERFAPIRLLGEGAAARVWLVHDHETDDRVALKLSMSRWSRTPSALQRAEREMRILTDCDHPHVLRTMDWGMQPLPWIVMEAHRESLKDHVRASGAMSEAEVLRIAKDVLHGLIYLHDRGVVHRDLKPGNVLLAHDGHAVLADFGIARTHDPRITRTDQLLGSLMYMAPEQRDDAHRVDGRADLYGLAATMWYAAVGRTPPDLSLLELRPVLLEKLPERLREPVARAAHSDPAGRYPSAAAMLDALA